MEPCQVSIRTPEMIKLRLLADPESSSDKRPAAEGTPPWHEATRVRCELSPVRARAVPAEAESWRPQKRRRSEPQGVPRFVLQSGCSWLASPSQSYFHPPRQGVYQPSCFGRRIARTGRDRF